MKRVGSRKLGVKKVEVKVRGGKTRQKGLGFGEILKMNKK